MSRVADSKKTRIVGRVMDSKKQQKSMVLTKKKRRMSYEQCN